MAKKNVGYSRQFFHIRRVMLEIRLKTICESLLNKQPRIISLKKGTTLGKYSTNTTLMTVRKQFKMLLRCQCTLLCCTTHSSFLWHVSNDFFCMYYLIKLPWVSVQIVPPTNCISSDRHRLFRVILPSLC